MAGICEGGQHRAIATPHHLEPARPEGQFTYEQQAVRVKCRETCATLSRQDNHGDIAKDAWVDRHPAFGITENPFWSKVLKVAA